MREIYQYGPAMFFIDCDNAKHFMEGVGEAFHGDIIGRHDDRNGLGFDSVPLTSAWSELGRPVQFKRFAFTNHLFIGVGWGELPSNEPGEVLVTQSQSSLLQRDGVPTLVKYWHVRNSWAEQWANSGYGRLLRGYNAGGVELAVAWVR